MFLIHLSKLLLFTDNVSVIEPPVNIDATSFINTTVSDVNSAGFVNPPNYLILIPTSLEAKKYLNSHLVGSSLNTGPQSIVNISNNVLSQPNTKNNMMQDGYSELLFPLVNSNVQNCESADTLTLTNDVNNTYEYTIRRDETEELLKVKQTNCSMESVKNAFSSDEEDVFVETVNLSSSLSEESILSPLTTITKNHGKQSLEDFSKKALSTDYSFLKENDCTYK